MIQTIHSYRNNLMRNYRNSLTSIVIFALSAKLLLFAVLNFIKHDDNIRNIPTDSFVLFLTGLCLLNSFRTEIITNSWTWWTKVIITTCTSIIITRDNLKWDCVYLGTIYILYYIIFPRLSKPNNNNI